MEHLKLKEITGNEKTGAIYYLEALYNEAFYKERVNRNIGWITNEEQEMLRNSTVGIAGCGGMGGLLAITLHRLGIGKIKIADNEEFDISNLNRQFGALKSTLGKSKALITGKMMREISTDTEIIVYPSGIIEDTSESFISGCDLICDEIEFWGIGSKILLHQESRKKKVPILSCNTVGHQANLMFFDNKSKPIEEVMGLSYIQAKNLQYKIQNKVISKFDLLRSFKAVTQALVPNQPDYDSSNLNDLTLRGRVLKRLEEEMNASIIATNPSFASGFLSNHVLFQLLKESKVKRDIVLPPRFPGYLSIDSALFNMSRVVR